MTLLGQYGLFEYDATLSVATCSLIKSGLTIFSNSQTFSQKIIFFNRSSSSLPFKQNMSHHHPHTNHRSICLSLYLSPITGCLADPVNSCIILYSVQTSASSGPGPQQGCPSPLGTGLSPCQCRPSGAAAPSAPPGRCRLRGWADHAAVAP